MAKNQRYSSGDQLNLPVPSGIDSGEPVRVGCINGVALTTRDANGNATIATDGVYDLSVTGATTLGGIVYISTANALTTTAGTNQVFGHALAVQAATGVVPVRIAQFAPTAAS